MSQHASFLQVGPMLGLLMSLSVVYPLSMLVLFLSHHRCHWKPGAIYWQVPGKD